MSVGKGIVPVLLCTLVQGLVSAASLERCPCPAGGPGGYGPAPATQSPLYPGAQNGAGTQNDGSDYSDLGETQAGYLASNMAVAGAGAGGAFAIGTFNGEPFLSTTVTGTTSLVSPGFLTAATIQPPVPTNRVFFNYSFYDRFQVVQTTFVPLDSGQNSYLLAAQTKRFAGFNLSQYNVGFEKTIFNGKASVYAQAPFLNASDNISGQAINGVGDVTAGFKILLKTWETGSVVSTGVTVAAPTARAGQFQSFQTQDFSNGPAPNVAKITNVNEHVNPTFVQPYITGMLNGERCFVQQYVGALIPTSGQFVTSLNCSTSWGYRMFSGGCGYIQAITPVVTAQLLIPLANGGTPSPISYPTQVFLTEGVQVMVGPRLALFGGVMQPIAQPQAFTVGANFGANVFF